MADEEFKKALEASPEIELTVTGRTSGREISNPVWFAREGEKLYLVPVRGSDADWYKNVLKTPTIRLAAGGAQLSANASPISDAAPVNRSSTSSGPSTLRMWRRTTRSRMSRSRFRSPEWLAKGRLEGGGHRGATALLPAPTPARLHPYLHRLCRAPVCHARGREGRSSRQGLKADVDQPLSVGSP